MISVRMWLTLCSSVWRSTLPTVKLMVTCYSSLTDMQLCLVVFMHIRCGCLTPARGLPTTLCYRVTYFGSWLSVNSIANTCAGKFTVPQTRLAQKLMPGQSPWEMKKLLVSVILLSCNVTLSRGLWIRSVLKALHVVPPISVVCGLQPPHM